MPEPNREIRVCALMLYPYDTVPGQRYRIEQWDPFLKEQGISIDYFFFADKKLTRMMPNPGNVFAKAGGLVKGLARRIYHLSKLREYDVILIYRAATMVGPAFFERIIKFTGRPIIFDFDDAIFITHTNEANKLFGWLKFAGKTGTICRLSTSIIAGNEWLSQYARKYNSNVTVIPSSVNTKIYSPQLKTEKGKIIIGWTGSSTSQTHLEIFAPVLKKLLSQCDAEIHVHSDRAPELGNVPCVWHKWSPENEVEVISTFDIGIMPLPDDEWSLGKCSMKALLYMSLGVPTVCSDIGMNREVIKHGENGFLAATEEDWLKLLEHLVKNKFLREKIGGMARKTIVNNYSMEICADLFGKVVRDTLSSSK